jgi:tetratricopeptide (TPR) repeat protein
MKEDRRERIEGRGKKEKNKGSAFFCFFFLLSSIFYFLTSAQPAFTAEPVSFEAANTKYQAGDFKAAAALYEEIIKNSQGTGAVYFNLGNTYFRLGQKGKAVIAYERAFKVIPRDKDLLWNMNVLKSVLPDRIEPVNENLIVYWLKTMAAKFTIDEISLAITAALGWWLLTAVLLFFIPQAKRVMRIIRAPIILFLAVAAVLFFFNWIENKDPKVVILNKEVFARYGPSEK